MSLEPVTTKPSIPATPVTLVVGKGGVGKSTVSRALADLQARAGHTTVRLSVDHAGEHARRGAAPRGEPAGAGVREVALDWDEALTAAAGDVFGSPRAARALLGNFAMRRLMKVLPGVREYSLLLASYQWRDRADRVVIDMPATGHGLSWIDTVSLAAKIFPRGRIRERATGLLADLRNPEVTSVVLVTVAEPVISSESRELRAGIEQSLGMSPALTVVNRSPHQPTSSEGQLAALLLQCPGVHAEVDALRAWCDDQRRTLALVGEHPAPVATVRKTPGDPVAAAAQALDDGAPGRRAA